MIYSELNRSYFRLTASNNEILNKNINIVINELKKYINIKEPPDWVDLEFKTKDPDLINELKKYYGSPENEDEMIFVLQDILSLYEELQEEFLTEAINHVFLKQSQISENTQYGSGISAEINKIGTMDVDISELNSEFGSEATNDAMELVRKFFSDLLKDIVSIGITKNSGVFGVYESELTKNIMEQLVENNEISNEKAQEIINSGVGVAFRVNPDKIEQSKNELVTGATEHYENLKNNYSDQEINEIKIQDEKEIYALALGETIVHEATHAAGAHTEGPAIAAERSFLEAAINYLNQLRENKNWPNLPIALK